LTAEQVEIFAGQFRIKDYLTHDQDNCANFPFQGKMSVYCVQRRVRQKVGLLPTLLHLYGTSPGGQDNCANLPF
jgi:hypothetical protein